jgi:hypothetical protein
MTRVLSVRNPDDIVRLSQAAAPVSTPLYEVSAEELARRQSQYAVVEDVTPSDDTPPLAIPVPAMPRGWMTGRPALQARPSMASLGTPFEVQTVCVRVLASGPVPQP